MTSKRTKSRHKESAAEVVAARAQGVADGTASPARQGQSGADTEPPTSTTPGSRRTTKAGLIQQMLSAPDGATLAAFSQATGWQAHTVRAALTRLRQAGAAIERTRSEEGETIYRILSTAGLAAQTQPNGDDVADPPTTLVKASVS